MSEGFNFDELTTKLQELDVHSLEIKPDLRLGEPPDKQAWVTAIMTVKTSEGAVQHHTLRDRSLAKILKRAEKVREAILGKEEGDDNEQ